MTRRRILGALVATGATLARTIRSRTEVAQRAAAFVIALNRWIVVFNRMRPGSLDLGETEAFAPLDKLWRDLRDARTDWLRGADS